MTDLNLVASSFFNWLTMIWNTMQGNIIFIGILAYYILDRFIFIMRRFLGR